MLIQVIIQQKLGSLTNYAYLRAWESPKPNWWLFNLLKNKCMVILFWTSFLISLQMHLPIKWLPQSVLKKPMGGALHIRRRYWRFVFCTSKLPQSNTGQKQCKSDYHGVWYIFSVVCCEDFYPQSTLYGCFYILQRGCLLCLFSSLAVVGHEVEQADVKHPRFFICG